ncbi:MAG: DUF1579 domain-containing protein [Rubrivivax sp.]
MQRHRLVRAGLLLIALAGSLPASAQNHPDPGALIAAQKEGMVAIQAMDGVWRGTAWTLTPTGERRDFVQTERIGPFLDGSVKVIEGRGYDQGGQVTFNALGIVSYNPSSRTYGFRAYAQGQVGDFAFVPTVDGYTWDIPAGPMTIRYTAVIRGGVLTEVGDRLQAGKEPVRFFEMNLKRVGDTEWPAAGAIVQK